MRVQELNSCLSGVRGVQIATPNHSLNRSLHSVPAFGGSMPFRVERHNLIAWILGPVG